MLNNCRRYILYIDSAWWANVAIEIAQECSFFLLEPILILCIDCKTIYIMCNHSYLYNESAPDILLLRVWALYSKGEDVPFRGEQKVVTSSREIHNNTISNCICYRSDKRNRDRDTRRHCSQAYVFILFHREEYTPAKLCYSSTRNYCVRLNILLRHRIKQSWAWYFLVGTIPLPS